MNEKLRRFGVSLKHTLVNLGNSTSKVLENLEKSDREMNEKIKKITGNVE